MEVAVESIIFAVGIAIVPVGLLVMLLWAIVQGSSSAGIAGGDGEDDVGGGGGLGTRPRRSPREPHGGPARSACRERTQSRGSQRRTLPSRRRPGLRSP